MSGQDEQLKEVGGGDTGCVVSEIGLNAKKMEIDNELIDVQIVTRACR